MTWEWQWECCQCRISMNSIAIETCPDCCSHVRCECCAFVENRHQERTKKPVSSTYSQGSKSHQSSFTKPVSSNKYSDSSRSHHSSFTSPVYSRPRQNDEVRNQYRTGRRQTSKQQAKNKEANVAWACCKCEVLGLKTGMHFAVLERCPECYHMMCQDCVVQEVNVPVKGNQRRPIRRD